MNKLIWMTAVVIGLIGPAGANTIFSATTGNTTLVNNNFNSGAGATLTGATPDLLYSNQGGINNNGGFTSADGLDVLMGSSLTVTQQVSFSATVDSMTAATLHANGLVFGMSPITAFQPVDNLLLHVKADSAACAINGNACVDGNTGAGFSIVESSLEDGFGITLTANNAGYLFTLTDVVTGTGATTASFSGLFDTGEFTSYFGAAHFYLGAQTDGAPSPMEIDSSTATISVVELSEVPSTPPAPESVFFQATTGNTTLVNNGTADSGLLTLTGATPDLVLNNANGGFNNGGVVSTGAISELLETTLDSADAVSFSVTVDSIGGTGELRANGITFGMAGAASFGGGGAPSLLLGIEAGNSGSDVTVASSFVTGGDAGFNVEQSSLEDGFTITLTANSSGYSFELSDIEVSGSGNTTASVYDSFPGTEFVDYFNDGHFYIAAQKWNNGDVELDISEAKMELVEVTELTPLAGAMASLKNHITGTSTLTAAQINTQAGIIETYADEVGDTSGNIIQALDLVETYETVKGALFLNSVGSNFSRTDTSSVNKALALAMLKVYQAIIDDVYNTANLNAYSSILNGAKFVSADYFPGAVTPPTDPDAVYSVQINASQPKAWGYEVDFQTLPARRPTGAYLAPGSFATVTVPQALVNKGFQVRVGAHVADLSNKSSLKRIDRVSLLYDITSTDTVVANPLGGGIYIEVPYEIEEGLVTVDIKNTVRSPFYSNSSARQTTLSEWQDTERHHPGPWADFETDKFMLNVPTDWIYAYNNPVTPMANWDKAMDAVSDMQGLPRVRPKTVLYCQIDVLLDAGAYSPGYPQSNDSWSPTSSAGGDKDHDYLNGPKFADHVILHELGHATAITKFTGEMEALVNFLYVPVHNRMFDVDFEEAFGKSLNTQWGGAMNRKHAAINWAVHWKFRNGKAMTADEMKYQHRGYAKYAEIAALFGWDAIGDFWHSVAVDYENGISYSKNYDPPDSRIIRMSRAAGANLLPLIHFWGVHPDNASSIESTLEAEGIEHSAAIYDRLKYYQTVIPMSAAEFIVHDNAVGNLVSVNDQANYDGWRTSWTEAMGQAAVDRIQDIIDTYFPAGRPIESLPHFEDFEDGIGGWAQATDDNYEWRRNSGGTASGAAGPDGASSGDYYMYAEGHDAPGANKTASFLCTFDFSGVTDAAMTFDYHMYGNYIDFLSVDVYDGTTWTTDVWKRTGKQHTSSSAAWSSAEVDLSAFSGFDEVTIRFRTKNTQYNSADPAIDNIVIAEITPYNQWADTAFSGASAGADRTATGNPDGDRFNNQMEWALNLDPLMADEPELNAGVRNDTFEVLYERRDPAVTGIDVYASWAASLSATIWRLDGDGLTESSNGWSNDVETVSVSLSLDHTNAFICIQTEEQD